MTTPAKPGNEDSNVQTVLDAFDTLFNKRDYAAPNATGLRTTFSTAPTFRPDLAGSSA
jgi:hypothetical protein